MLTISKQQFVDAQGRAVMLRGINLGGSTKLPAKPYSATHNPKKFYDYKSVTFVGRPFSAPEADEHFARLRQWGFNCLRFLVTWEAIERVGPGHYDLLYLDYLTKMVEKAGEYGFYVVIDPHQDVWSRWTGGDGAPAWTLEKVGFNLETLHDSGSAVLHHLEDDYLTMQWVTNYGRLAAATMFTLFFAGHDFAPELEIDGQPVQEFLQSHYFRAVREVAKRLKQFDHVIGYDSLNEPHEGFVGKKDLASRKEILVAVGPTPSPFEGMILGSGRSLDVPILQTGAMGVRKHGSVQLNPKRVSAWVSEAHDIWKMHGVWDDSSGEPQLLRSDYFQRVNGRDVDFSEDYLRPFLTRFIHEIRAEDDQTLIFLEPTLGSEVPKIDAPNLVYAPHWYDAVALFQRRYVPNLGFDTETRRPAIGKNQVKKSFAKQFARMKDEGHVKLDAPTWVGEFGLSFDLNERVAFTDGDFSPHIATMDRTYQALDANMLSGTLWNYTADNTNEHGDGWNGEDLSIFSRDQLHPLDDAHDLDAGGRALSAVIRPYPKFTAGEPIEMSFDIKTRDYSFTFKHDPAVSAPTELFVPDYHYSVGLGVDVTDGRVDYDQKKQTLFYWPSSERDTHTIRLYRSRGPAEIDEGVIWINDDLSYPIEHRFINTNGIQLHTVLAGPEDGKPIVFLHGFPEFWYGWREQIPYFVRRGYRVIVPDQRGYNLSDKPKGVSNYGIDLLAADIIGLLDALSIKQSLLVAHDWGAMVAWWLAADYPSRFERVVTLNVPHPAVFKRTVFSSPRQTLKSWYAASFQIPYLPERIGRLGNWRIGSDLMRRFSAHPDTFSDEDMARYREAWSRPKAMESMLNWYRTFMRKWPELKNPRITMPMLLIWGAQDVALSRQMAKPSIDEYCDDGLLVFIEEATHWVQHDEPERVNQLIERFFEPTNDE